ncbi:cell envelope biogenesis protein LolA [Rhodothermaceae bacterium RA]|nr:cell envelope biogenesis protein LolA [Rhodothermaceae bacterium RA]
MNSRPFPARVLAVLAIVLFTGQSAALAQDAHALFERLKTTYETIDALQARFQQTMSTPYSDREETFSGTIVFQRDRYRVETGTQTFVTDGTVTWVYLPDANQVLINDYVEDETAFSLNSFFLNYTDRYEVTSAETVQLDGATHYLLRLKPRNPDTFFTDIAIWMRDRDNLVTRMEVTDVNETRMTFHLEDIQLNPVLRADTFTFTPPEHAEVIDLRS